MLLEKPDITYCGTLNAESLEPSCRINPRPMTMLKILNEDHQFFPNLRGIKSFYDRRRKQIDLLVGGTIWDRRDYFSKFSTRPVTGARGKGVFKSLSNHRLHCFFLNIGRDDISLGCFSYFYFGSFLS